MSGIVSMFDFVKKKRSVHNPNLTDKEVEILMALPNEYQGFRKVFDDDSLVEYIKGQKRYAIDNSKGTDKFTIYQCTQTDSYTSSNFEMNTISINVELQVAVSRMFQAIDGEGLKHG